MTAQERMRTGSVWRLFVDMSLPAILVVLVMVLYNMADLYFIGRSGDPAQVAAVSLAGPLYGALQGLGTLLGSGGCTALAIALGKGESGRARAITSFCFYGTLVIGAAFVALAPMAPGIAALLGADGSVAPYAAEYVRVLCLGAPLMLYPAVFANIARADGSVKQAMASNIAGTLTNIALDPLFIGTFGLGVRGAALATVAGNAVSAALLIWLVTAKRRECSHSPRDLNFGYQTSWHVLALGLPMTMSTLLGSCAGALGNNLMAAYGSAAVAAAGVASKAGMIVCMVEIGLCMGIQPAISYCYGAGDITRVHDIVKKTLLVSFGSALMLTLGLWVCRAEFIAMFISDERVLEYGLMIIAPSLAVCPLCGPYQACTTYLQGTGNAAYAVTLSALRQGAAYVPMLYMMNALGGLSGLIYAGPITDVLALALAAALCLRWRRRMPAPDALSA